MFVLVLVIASSCRIQVGVLLQDRPAIVGDRLTRTTTTTCRSFPFVVRDRFAPVIALLRKRAFPVTIRQFILFGLVVSAVVQFGKVFVVNRLARHVCSAEAARIKQIYQVGFVATLLHGFLQVLQVLVAITIRGGEGNGAYNVVSLGPNTDSNKRQTRSLPSSIIYTSDSNSHDNNIRYTNRNQDTHTIQSLRIFLATSSSSRPKAISSFRVGMSMP